MEVDGEGRTRSVEIRFEGNSLADPSHPAGFRSTPAEPASTAVGSALMGVLRTMRPRQWVKNVLVLAAPIASGRALDPDVLRSTVSAFALFCLVASGVYLINDVRDAQEDRRHPAKRHRPVAAGVTPVPTAVAVGVVLLVGPLVGAVVMGNTPLAGVLTTYVAISLAYSFFLKDQPVVDLAAVASGFLLRAIAGGAAAGIPLSQWFLLVTSFGALFMVAGKRYAELVTLGDGETTRRSLHEYSPSYLRFVWSLSAAVACMAYSLWAFEMREAGDGFPWQALSIAPFVLALLRYAVDVDRGQAGAPEDIVMGDRVLLLFGGVWLTFFGLGVWLG